MEAANTMNFEDFTQQLSKADPRTLAVMLVIFLVVLLANILYYRTLQRTMSVISPSLRPCPPALIWLALLPYLGIIWYMIYIVMLSLALQKELARREIQGNGAIGITVALVVLFGLCMVPKLGLLVIIPAVAMWIMHWQRMAIHYKLLAEPVYLMVD